MIDWLEHFLAHRPLLFRVIGRIVPPDEIEDIMQDTFLQTYAAARRKSIANPRAYMVTTARNIALNHVQCLAQKLNTPLDADLDFSDDEDEDPVGQQYHAHCEFMVFCDAVADLPTGCRKVFVLKKVNEMSQREIAERLGISTKTVEKHVSKGLARTAAYMASRGYAVRHDDAEAA